MKIIIIAAVSGNNVIGREGAIPWHSREELSYFKEATYGFPVIMGKNTFLSIGKPLTGRLNIIITSNPQLFIKFEDIKCFFNLKEALFFCENNYFERVFIAGGAKLYSEAIEKADEMIISRMNFDVEGDTFFPYIDPEIWDKTKGEKYNEFETYIYTKKVK